MSGTPRVFAFAAMSAVLCVAPALAVAAPEVNVRDGQFMVGDDPVPAGCLQRLMTDLNGDDIARSVFLTRASVRGCIDANDPGGDADYGIVKVHGDDTYDVRICERIDGSLGANCGTLIVRFATYRYEVAGTVKAVLAIDKLGER